MWYRGFCFFVDFESAEQTESYNSALSGPKKKDKKHYDVIRRKQ